MNTITIQTSNLDHFTVYLNNEAIGVIENNVLVH